ncbi:diacylglycerol/lipid kinase family protein [Motiliproteus sediminis]|uniref:diacylglycerol/lipid kinase family protein n=1 Tax=Motiliproteus sediminis TaxID=1468178 RepID=UPI001AF02673|nr:diacylglycerol kinase family protein [Motiliproteus sediminis]
MATYLVTHRALADSPERLKPWLQALADANITLDGRLLLDRHDWAAAVVADDRLLALGGDGTQSAVATICVAKQAQMGVLPAGTGNDFARALGVPLGPSGAVDLLRSGQEQRLDVGRINNRIYLNVAHVGLGAQVGAGTSQAIKRRWGPLSYLRHLLTLLFRKRGFWGRITYDGRVLYGRWLEIAIANGPSFGGGHQIDGARLDSAALTLVCVRARPLPRLFLAWLLARLGRPLNRKVIRLERVTDCRLDTHRRLLISADGEAVGYTPLHAWVEPASLRVIAPV